MSRKSKGKKLKNTVMQSQNDRITRGDGWMITGAIAPFQPHKDREYRNRGTFGPASEVRHIDPADYVPK